MACVSKEGEEYAKANAEAAKNPDPEAAKKMAEDPKFQELTKKMTECTTKLATGAAGAAGGAAAAPPAPAAGSDQAAPAAPAAGGDGSAAAPAAGSDGSAAK
jgi:hypothetical protein